MRMNVSDGCVWSTGFSRKGADHRSLLAASRYSNSTLSIFDLAVDFIGFGRPAAGRPNPMKSTAKSKMDKVESKRSRLIA